MAAVKFVIHRGSLLTSLGSEKAKIQKGNLLVSFKRRKNLLGRPVFSSSCTVLNRPEVRGSSYTGEKYVNDSNWDLLR